MQDTGVETHVAFPVAVVAAVLFDAAAGERGQVWDPEKVRANAERHAAENAARKRITGIEDGRERLEAVVEVLKVGGPSLPPRLDRVVAEVAPEVIPELVALLGADDQGLRLLACDAPASAGAAAAPAAVPALTAQLKRGDWMLSHSAALALAAMGRGGRTRPRSRPRQRGARPRRGAPALAKLDSLSDSAQAKLARIAEGQGELADMAKHALGESAIARRLARAREATAKRDPVAQSQVLAERLRNGEIDAARLRFAAYLGDAGSQIVLEGACTEPPKDLSVWAANLLEAPDEWFMPVLAAALDARSTTLRPRSAALTQAVARTLREGTAHARLQELLEAHDWLQIPGLDLGTVNSAVAASEACGEERRQHLLRIMRTLDAGGACAAFFSLLQEEAIPTVLGTSG